MALSNILREPRREITESAVGMAIFGGAVWADYRFGHWLEDLLYDPKYPTSYDYFWPIGMVIGAILAIVIVGVLFLTHEFGEGICNGLQTRGVHLRPRQRR